ncbi:hypothetical protein ACP4OV_024918 [Aristida adscensionis]
MAREGGGGGGNERWPARRAGATEERRRPAWRAGPEPATAAGTAAERPGESEVATELRREGERVR